MLKTETKKEVFVYTSEECGQNLLFENASNLIENLEGDLQEMDCDTINEIRIVIKKVLMSEEEIKKLPEFDGC